MCIWIGVDDGTASYSAFKLTLSCKTSIIFLWFRPTFQNLSKIYRKCLHIFSGFFPTLVLLNVHERMWVNNSSERERERARRKAKTAADSKYWTAACANTNHKNKINEHVFSLSILLWLFPVWKHHRLRFHHLVHSFALSTRRLCFTNHLQHVRMPVL